MQNILKNHVFGAIRMSFIAAFSVATLAACSSKPCRCDTAGVVTGRTVSLPNTIEEAVDSPLRVEANRARDRYRHPVDTLRFFGLKPEMTVVEVSPGSGWYYEILAPLLAKTGHYIAAAGGMHDTFSETTPISSEAKQKVTIVPFNLPTQTEIAPVDTADMVLTFRNVHNWMAAGTEQAAFNAFYRALKPGGILGVVEHRADPKSAHDPKAKSGYVHESDIIRMAQKAGFQLTGQSEINANPKDKKNYPAGVWTLPPTYKLGDKNKERYTEIGESDRMTLRFVKPVKH